MVSFSGDIILKNQGYNLTHNYGHGKEFLSQNICSLNILSFLFHTIQEFVDKQYVELRKVIGTRKEFFGSLNFITTLFIVKDFDKMIEFTLFKRTNRKIELKDYIVMDGMG